MPDTKTFDILIIGGGITGAAVARDAAMRGFSVVLIEKGDFCSGASSRSTKILHGGLRYLEQLNFNLVLETLKEREIIKNIAPCQIKRVPFLLPIYKNDRFGTFKISMGMKLYNWLSPKNKSELYTMLKPETAVKREPHILQEGLSGALLYNEYILISPERYILSMIRCASRHGSKVRNYMQVKNFLWNGNKAAGIEAVDTLNGTKLSVFAKVIINAAGPWVDDVLRMVNPNAGRKLVKTKGIHFLIPKISGHAVLYAARKDGKLIFGIPWLDYTIIGSTDTVYKGDLDEVYANKDEVEGLLTEFKQVFDHPLIDWHKIVFTYAGIRPLAFEGSESNFRESIKHVIFEGDEEGGIISTVGGKLTTARLMAEQIVNMASERLGKKTDCLTAELPLPGGGIPEQMSGEDYCATILQKYSVSKGISGKTIEYLVHSYGTDYKNVLDLAEKVPEGKEALCSHSPGICAQVHYAVQYEGAKTLLDILFRRTEIGIGPALQPAECKKIVDIMALYLNWDKDQKKKEIDSYFIDREKQEQF